jgi:hypothetical protein
MVYERLSPEPADQGDKLKVLVRYSTTIFQAGANERKDSSKVEKEKEGKKE